MSANLFTDQNFKGEVLKSSLPVLVDFYAEWCGPCRMMAPIIEELSVEYEGKMKIGKLDIDKNSQIAEQYGVMSVPTLMLFKEGQIICKVVGLHSKEEMKERIKEKLSL